MGIHLATLPPTMRRDAVFLHHFGGQRMQQFRAILPDDCSYHLSYIHCAGDTCTCVCTTNGMQCYAFRVCIAHFTQLYVIMKEKAKHSQNTHLTHQCFCYDYKLCLSSKNDICFFSQNVGMPVLIAVIPQYSALNCNKKTRTHRHQQQFHRKTKELPESSPLHAGA